MLRRVMMGAAQGGGGWGDDWARVVVLLHVDSLPIVDQKGGSWALLGAASVDDGWSRFGAGSLYVPATTLSGLSGALPAGADLSGDYTVSFWVRPDSTTSVRPFIYIMSGNSIRLAMYLSTGGAWQITASGDNSQRPSGGAGAFATGVQRHVAIVRKNGAVRIYLDGVAQGQDWTAAGSQSDLTGCTVYVGRDGANNWRLSGRMDEILVYRGALFESNFTPPGAPYPDGP